MKLSGGAGCLYTLQDGRLLHLAGRESASLDLLNLQPGESFRICLHQQPGGIPYWDMWLSPETEKRRAEAEQPELERQLAASLAVVGRRKVPELAEAERFAAAVLPSTGTDGPTPLRKPAIAAVAGGKREKPGPIPANVAFGEILEFTNAELKRRGISWNDQTVQDFLSTVWISGCKAGWITLWEREAA